MMQAPHPTDSAAASGAGKDIAQALASALGYLQSGRAQLADFVSAQVIEKLPEHAMAWHYNALAQLALGRADLALERMAKAIALAPADPACKNDMGEILRGMGRAEEALDAYREALALDPQFSQAHNNLGVALRQMDRVDAAVEHFRAAVSIRPDYPEARLNLAFTLCDAGRFEDAIPELEAAARIAPDQIDVWRKLAHANLKLARGAAAAHPLREVVRLDADDAETWSALGNCLLREKDHAGALEAYSHAVALKPDSAWDVFHRGLVLENLSRLEEALADVKVAERLMPDNVTVLCREAALLRNLKRLDEAEEKAEQAYALQPDHAHVQNVLGLIHLSRRRWDQASAAFMAAAEAAPEKALPLLNMVSLYGQRGDHEKRRHYCRLALERAPDDAEIRFSYALTQLLLADWTEAWRNYAHRPNVTWTSGYDMLEAPLPVDLRGKRILVQMDQGLGDELLFLRFGQVLKQRGAWIAYRPNPKLASFVGKLPFIDMAVSHREAPKDVDYRVAVCDLALAVDMRVAADIPPPVQLVPSPGALGQARRMLAPLGDGPFIGVTWRGGTSKEEFSKWNVLYKEIDLDLLADLLRDKPGRILILQRKPKPGEIERFAARLGRPVHDFTAVNEQLEVMLALLSLIDEYVAVSNTNVHLRAGAGRISRVLIPHPPDWRWMTSGRSPWYPDIPTYREACGGAGWGEALAALDKDLRETS